MNTAPPPVRLRPVTDMNIGTTAFFRNRPLLNALCAQLETHDAAVIDVLFHACSIGAEVYSFLIACRLHPVLAQKTIRLAACDLDPAFVNYARQGVYPATIVQGMSQQERAFFVDVDEHSVRVLDELRSLPDFLPATSFVDFETSRTFDVVFLLNALLYVPGEKQSEAIDRISTYSRRWLVTTGFHFDRIRDDLRRNGYAPVPDGAREIHDAWLDRRRPVTEASEVIPGKIFHTWSLPPFEMIEDYAYKYCAIFVK